MNTERPMLTYPFDQLASGFVAFNLITWAAVIVFLVVLFVSGIFFMEYPQSLTLSYLSIFGFTGLIAWVCVNITLWFAKAFLYGRKYVICIAFIIITALILWDVISGSSQLGNFLSLARFDGDQRNSFLTCFIFFWHTVRQHRFLSHINNKHDFGKCIGINFGSRLASII
jgi:hypothetical protein